MSESTTPSADPSSLNPPNFRFTVVKRDWLISLIKIMNCLIFERFGVNMDNYTNEYLLIKITQINNNKPQAIQPSLVNIKQITMLTKLYSGFCCPFFRTIPAYYLLSTFYFYFLLLFHPLTDSLKPQKAYFVSDLIYHRLITD